MTGRRSVGGTWLTENLDLIVKEFHPDLIVVDNVHDIPRNYALLRERGMAVPGYEQIAHDPEAEFVVFRSLRPRAPRRVP